MFEMANIMLYGTFYPDVNKEFKSKCFQIKN